MSDYIIVARDPENLCKSCGHHRGMHGRGVCGSVTHINAGNGTLCCPCQGFVPKAERAEVLTVADKKKLIGKNKNWGWRG